MKTIEEAIQEPGITRTNSGLNLHFSPIPNWYGCILGFECPLCDNPIKWEWEGKLPNFTGDNTPNFVKPKVDGGQLIGYGHRWIRLECNKCHTQLEGENFG